MRNSILSLCFLVYSTTLFAQNNLDTLVFKDGSVRVVDVTNMGIIITNLYRLEQVKVYVNTGAKKPEKFSAEELQQIRFGGYTFDLVEGIFMELMIDGKMKLYMGHYPLNDVPIDMDSAKWANIRKDVVKLRPFWRVVYKDRSWEMEAKYLNNTYMDLFSECPAIVKQLSALASLPNRYYSDRELTELVTKFNNGCE
jgi:hypothetical protein